MELGHVRGWVCAESFRERVPQVLIDGQRVRLPTGAVQRPHELRAWPLPQWVRGCHLLQFGDDSPEVAQFQPSLSMILHGGHPRVFESDCLSVGEGHPGHIRQRRSAPQLKSLVQSRRRTGMVAHTQRVPPIASKPFEPVPVDVVGIDRHPVTGPIELDHIAEARRAAQPAAKTGHLGLQCVGGAFGRILAVQTVDEPLAGDHPPRVQEEQGEQRTHLGPAYRHRLAVGGPHLQRTQDAESH